MAMKPSVKPCTPCYEIDPRLPVVIRRGQHEFLLK